jgi:hypothetical protein
MTVTAMSCVWAVNGTWQITSPPCGRDSGSLVVRKDFKWPVRILTVGGPLVQLQQERVL